MPRHGSMQYWPRKRAKRSYPRIRSWAIADSNAKGALGFAGYKVGMTHVIVTDNGKHSMSKGEKVALPVTVLECPPLKVASVRFYKEGYHGLEVATEVFGKVDAELSRKLDLKKADATSLDSVSLDGVVDVRLNVYTQPKMTGIGQKKPEIFEVGIAGSVADQLAYAKDKLSSEIKVSEIFHEGEQIDIHSVTKGKGFTGATQRFGLQLRAKKSEKGQRGPGSLGGWKSQAHVMYRVAYPGQHGVHARTEFNKQIVKIGENGVDVNPEGGYTHYGVVKNDYLLIKGSVPGTKNHIVRLKKAYRPNAKFTKEAPSINLIKLDTNQG